MILIAVVLFLVGQASAQTAKDVFESYAIGKWGWIINRNSYLQNWVNVKKST